MVNKVILVGNLGKDPEVRFTPGGKAVAKFPVATSERWTDPDGTRQERTEWHNVVVWGKQAESCGQYLAKGRQVFIEGSIRNRQYDDKDGNKRYITEVVARDVRFLGGGGAGGASGGGGGGGGMGGGGGGGGMGGGGRGGHDGPPSVPQGEDYGPPDDDIPF